MDRAQAEGLEKENLRNMPRAAEKAVSDAKDLIGSKGMEYLKSSVDDIRDSARRIVDYSSETIRQRPFYAILGAAAFGIAIGLLLRRPSRD